MQHEVREHNAVATVARIAAAVVTPEVIVVEASREEEAAAAAEVVGVVSGVVVVDARESMGRFLKSRRSASGAAGSERENRAFA